MVAYSHSSSVGELLLFVNQKMNQITETKRGALRLFLFFPSENYSGELRACFMIAITSSRCGIKTAPPLEVVKLSTLSAPIA